MLSLRKSLKWLVLVVGTVQCASAQIQEPISPIPIIEIENQDLWALGRLLFHDRRLSKDDSLACVSCHDLASNGADTLALSLGVDGREAELNTPTVFNATYNFRQFWDGRAATLTDQASGPVYNPNEMDSNWVDIIKKLSVDPIFTQRFLSVFNRPLDKNGLIEAIAAFGVTLTTPGAPFDLYLQGDKQAVSEGVIKGYQLFKEFGCVSCHQGINVGGNMYQKLGVFEDYFASIDHIEKRDYGRFNVTNNPEDKFVFKVPSLRNVALTAPYFHHGQVETLEEAVKLMAAYQLGVDINEEEIGYIVDFLQSLTGEFAYKGN